MDWGILSGLGEGLQNIGNTLFSAELSKKLEEDRYQREMSKYDPSQDKYEQIATDGGPLWHKVRYNKAGDVIDRTLAPKNVIDEMTAAQEERALSTRLKKAQVENTEYTGSRAKIEDTREDEDWNRLTPEEKRREARIKAGLDVSAAQKLTADTSIKSAMARASRGDNTPEMSQAEVAKGVLNDSPQLESKWVDSKKMTKNQLLAAIMEADSRWRSMGKEGPPPMSYFDGYIEQMVNGDPAALGELVIPSLAKSPVTSGTRPTLKK